MTSLTENLKAMDLRDLVSKEIHIDEYKSKVGRDAEIIVMSFKVKGKDPAIDLVDFIEKGYHWVLDADVSSGEMLDGDYLVFVEINRAPSAVEKIMTLVGEAENLTGNSVLDTTFTYGKVNKVYEMTFDNLSRVMALTAKQYRQQYGKEDIEDLQTAAGIKKKKKAPKNKMTEMIRILSGIL